MRAFVFSLIIFLSYSITIQAADNATAWSGPHALKMDRASQVVDFRLANRLASLSDKNSLPVMVFFTDKGISAQAAYSSALDNAEIALTPAARERRLKARGQDEIVDFRDLPVYASYVNQVQSTGAKLRNTLKWFNAISVDATPAQVQAISLLPFTRLMKLVAGSKTDFDLPTAPSIPSEEPFTTLSYGPSAGQLSQINVITAHELGFKGQGIIVCMMDVGYKQNHQAFQNIISSGRRLAQYDFIHHDFNTDFDPSQDSTGQADHGTLTWSTLGGEASGHLYGPSYLASFILAKTEEISSERHIEEDNWAAGAQWADSIGASVISSSLGYRIFDAGQGDYQYSDLDGNTAIVTQAADLAAHNGITVCNAMGNEGNTPGSLIAPADADSIISCGAVDNSGMLASFSSWGPTFDNRTKPEVCAQGDFTACADQNDMSGYTNASGTSLSTPLVGGASGVLLSAHPNWSNMMVREALMMTATKTDSVSNAYGWGIMDVGRALYYHPLGDIIFNYQPLTSANPNQAINININITGGTGVASASLFWRLGRVGDFAELPLTPTGGGNFALQIPGQSDSLIQYYFKAITIDSNFAYYPVGGLMHPFTVGLGVTEFVDNFDNGLNYWESGGTKNSWGLNTKYAHSGFISMTDSPTKDYENNTDSWLKSKFVLDLTHVSGATFSFYWRGVMQSGHDSLHVEVSTDGGNNWLRLPQSLTGTGAAFARYNGSLAPYVGNSDVRLRFHFVSDATTRREGIYIDDFTYDWVSTGVADGTPVIPAIFKLSQNYPNPFNPSTIISFSLSNKAQVELNVFDLLGRHVKTLVTGDVSAGEHTIIWDGKDETGQDVSSGVYLYKLDSSGASDARRMTLLR
jgi:serine protease AprX